MGSLLERGAQNAGRTRAVPPKRNLSPVLGGWEQRQGTGAARWAPVFPAGARWPAPGGAGPLVGHPGRGARPRKDSPATCLRGRPGQLEPRQRVRCGTRCFRCGANAGPRWLINPSVSRACWRRGLFYFTFFLGGREDCHPRRDLGSTALTPAGFPEG